MDIQKFLVFSFVAGTFASGFSVGYLFFILIKAKRDGVPKHELSKSQKAKRAFYYMFASGLFTLAVIISMILISRS